MNARSIVNKIKELKVMIEEENMDIIAITETWLNDNVTDDEVSINGYTLFRKDRRDEVKCRGGGVAMYIKNKLNPTINSDLGNDSFSESIWCSIGLGSDNTILGVCYRAPDSIESNDEKLYNLINKVQNCKVIVMGDFNFPELDWSNRDNLDVQNPFVDCLLNNFLFQLVDEPTRGKNYLDLVLSSEKNMIQQLNVGEPFETSDHQIIRFEMLCKRLRIKTVQRSMITLELIMVR
jgi:hypothetical protein